MSGQNDDDKDIQKALPLDLARNQMTTVRTVDGKGPLLMTSQSLRGMRVLQGALPTSSATSVGGQTIITTNIVPQAMLKQDPGRAQLGIITSTQGSNPQGNLTIQQRPAQITLSTPLVAQTGASYHVPRGPAVVASLAANRSSVTTGHGFVRPPRTPSPAQATAWLTTNSSNGGQIKGATTVLSSPVRGATVTGKPQIVGRTQSGAVSTIRPGTILQNAIIAQPTQIHPYKPGTSNIQTIGSSVTIAQVLPSRTQAVVYSANTGSQFTHTRLTVASNLPNQRQNQGARPIAQVATARLTVPVNVSTSGARLVTPQTVLTSGARISAVQSTQQPTVLGGTTARIVSTQPSAPLGRLTVTTPTVVSANNVIGTRIGALNLSNISSLVAVANSPQQRGLQTQGPKVITQPAQAIHLASLQSPLKTTTQNAVSTSTRTISVPAAIVTQRQTTVVPSQAISIAKVFPSGDNQVTGSPANVFIHAPVTTSTAKRMSPNPNAVLQQHQQVSQGGGGISQAPTTTVAAAYSLPTGILAPNKSLLYNQVMMLDQSHRSQQPYGQSTLDPQEQTLPSKITSSPRPSILRKRDHDGSPLKASKNLIPLLTNVPLQSPTPVSPPSRPDSRGNGHSSGGSTTISATSSPGLGEVNDDSMPHAPVNIKDEEDVKPPTEMSPRKKPRKQQLTGSNDINEHNDDMQFISDHVKKEEDSENGQSDAEPRDGAPEAGGRVATVRKPATASLLNGYRQTWKATHNHYLRYSDVRPKEERKPSIMDLANQCRVQEKVNGWKIHHLTTQMEDLADQEHQVYNQLTDLLKCTELEETNKNDRDINRINELIKGNMQRIKIINDGMIDAKTQIMKIFDHKAHVTDIINRCASKRNFKKRDKST